MWAPITRRGQPAAVPEEVGGHLALDADADGGVRADADGEREDEQEQLRAPAAPVHEPHERRGLGHQPVVSAVRALVGLLVGGEVLRPCAWASSRSSASMPSSTLPASKSRQPVELDVGGLVGLGEVEAGDRGVEAAEDHDRAVLLADVVLVLATTTRPRRRAIQPRPITTSGGEEPLGPDVAARRARGVARRLGVDRVGGDRVRRAVGQVGRDRVELAGVARAVAAEEPRRCRPRCVGGARPRHRRPAASARAGAVVGLEDVGDHAGDVVGAAGLEAGADQLDRGVLRAAGGQDVGQPAVVEDAARAVAADQEPVARRRARGRRGRARCR